MTDGVIATVIFKTLPQATDECVAALDGMFPVTRTKPGFRSIRLLRSAHDPAQLILIQEWDSVVDHQAYMQFRAERGDLERLMAMTTEPMQLLYWEGAPLAAAAG